VTVPTYKTIKPQQSAGRFFDKFVC